MLWEDRVGRRLKLKDLHTLQTVAEVGSMAKAAHQLALSQPAISKAIAEMEQILGISLLDRNARGVELTESGRLLVERGRIIFDEVRQGVKDIEYLSDPTRGAVRIGTTEPMTVVISEIIHRMSRKYPRITYHVAVSDTTSLIRELRSRTLDVVVTRWNTAVAADDLAAEVLFKAPLAVMAEHRHPLARKSRLDLSDLMKEQWTLSPPGSALGLIVQEVFRRKKLELPPTIVTTISIYMRLNLLATGRFLSVLPMMMLQHRSNRAWLRALNVDLDDKAGPVASITLARRRSGGAIKLFQDASRVVCKEVGSGMSSS
jgi:DNA-binding transcriptional LysR family regulator